MPKRTRTSLSVDVDLLSEADRLVEKGLYRSRSHAFEEGIKKILIQSDIQKN